jgi:hypothetical protein
VANWLSADGVASLRYGKLDSGQTGWGKYAAHPDQVGIGPYEQEAVVRAGLPGRSAAGRPGPAGGVRAQRGRI